MRLNKGVFLVLLVKFCSLDGLSGEDDIFRPEKHKNFKLLPAKNECGIATQTTDILDRSGRIHGGYKTKLGEVPWIVTFGRYYKYPSPSEPFPTMCGGSLISKYYVLTAAHCTEPFENTAILRFVRFGEWNATGDPDCHGGICAPPVQDIKFNEIVKHNYDWLTMDNDIALLRLEKPPILNAFVQPVCLPYGPAMNMDFTDQETLVAGWGKTGSYDSF
ncbi:hypothetical protein WDU94_006800 [Cyamophila willieti]